VAGSDFGRADAAISGLGATKISIRPAGPGDRPALQTFLAEFGSERVARLGQLEDPLDHPAIVAESDGALAGVLTYIVAGPDCEVLTVHTRKQWIGVGTALLHAAENIASEHGCSRLWLITTNDNVDALRFYQRRGFVIAGIHAGAVNDARARLKPEIPAIGDYGIPIRDEIELEKSLGV
jgi:GNAT superfamily N-acetyltransferase